MSQIATVILSGYVAMEPKLWFTKEGNNAVVHLRIGTTPRRVDPLTGEWRDGGTSFFTVNCWRKLALNVHASLHKGDPVVIRGRLKTRTWVDEGKNRTLVEIDADSIGHDLTYGWSHYLKGIPPHLLPMLEPSGNADPGAGEDASYVDPGADDAGEDEILSGRPAGEDPDAAEPLGEAERAESLVPDHSEVPF